MLEKCGCGWKKLYCIRCCKKSYSNRLRKGIKNTVCKKEALRKSLLNVIKVWPLPSNE